MDANSLWHEILALARRAPSPHNVQPWKVKIISAREADLYIDTCRTLPKGDRTGSFVISTMGIFIEAIQIIAANRRLALEFSFYAELASFPPQFETARPKNLLFARLRLHDAPDAKSAYDDGLLQKRRTSREVYSDSPVPGSVLDRLRHLAAVWNQTLVPITQRDTITQLTRWDTEALFEDMNSPGYRDEIVKYFRYSDGESFRKRDGLDFRCMNFSRLEFWLAGRLPWLMKAPGLSGLMKKRYHRQFEPIRTMGYLAGRFMEVEAAFDAGRFLLQFWLEMTRHDVFLHPFGNLVTNAKAAARTWDKFGHKDIWLFFRMGHSPVPPQSRRLHVQELLLD